MIWSRPELQVLFVCTANICRSPLAEGLLRHRLRALGLAGRIRVLSAGTQAVQRGCRPDSRVEQLAAEEGVSLAGIRARMLTPALIRSSDYVLVMERRHLEEVRSMCPDCSGDSDGQYAEKIQLLGNFLATSDGLVQDIPDPYFGNLQGFCNVYRMIDLALTGFLNSLERNSGNTALKS